MAVPAFADLPEIPAETELRLASHAIARRICSNWPPGVTPVAYPLVAESIFELLGQNIIEIGPNLHVG